MPLTATKKGLPNNCSRCGRHQENEWYALDEQQAIAGQGICETCHKPKPKRGRPRKKPNVTDSAGDQNK